MGWEAGSGPPGPGPEPPRPCSSGPLSSRHFQPFTGLVKDDDARAWPPGSAPKTRTPPGPCTLTHVPGYTRRGGKGRRGPGRVSVCG